MQDLVVVSLLLSYEKASYIRGFSKYFGKIFYTSSYGIWFLLSCLCLIVGIAGNVLSAILVKPSSNKPVFVC